MFFYKTDYLNEEVNCTEPSPSVSIPWLGKISCRQNIFGAKAEQLLCKQFLMLLTATAFFKNVLKYGARCTSCSLRCAVKCQQKCWWNRRASLWHLLYAGAFAHWTHWLVKLTPGGSTFFWGLWTTKVLLILYLWLVLLSLLGAVTIVPYRDW